MRLRFLGRLRPVDAVGGPRLVGFCDSSEVAVCAALYVVWSTSGPLASVKIADGQMPSGSLSSA